MPRTSPALLSRTRPFSHPGAFPPQVIPQEKIHPDLWVGANKKWRRVPAARVERSSYGKERTEEEQAKVRAKLFKKDQARQQKIKDLGIDYVYEGFVSCAVDGSPEGSTHTGLVAEQAEWR